MNGEEKQQNTSGSCLQYVMLDENVVRKEGHQKSHRFGCRLLRAVIQGVLVDFWLKKSLIPHTSSGHIFFISQPISKIKSGEYFAKPSACYQQKKKSFFFFNFTLFMLHYYQSTVNREAKNLTTLRISKNSSKTSHMSKQVSLRRYQVPYRQHVSIPVLIPFSEFEPSVKIF